MNGTASVQKKICMLGAFAVGKTSLVARFVEGIFSERYLTTLGVKIDRKTLTVGGREINLILWDIHGEDELQRVRESYLRGAAGYLLVVDGTRRATLETVVQLQERAANTLGDVPFLVLLNKSDLHDGWDLDATAVSSINGRGWAVRMTSAKTGAGVEEAFSTLAARVMED
jgi:small GTP-binding protein